MAHHISFLGNQCESILLIGSKNSKKTQPEAIFLSLVRNLLHFSFEESLHGMHKMHKIILRTPTPCTIWRTLPRLSLLLDLVAYKFLLMNNVCVYQWRSPSKRKEVPLFWSLVKHDPSKENRLPFMLVSTCTPILVLFVLKCLYKKNLNL